MKIKQGHSLWIHTQPRPIRLRKPPQNVLGRLIDVRSTSELWEIPLQRHLWQLGFEHVDLVQEQDDGRPEEPSRVDDRFEQDERLRHAFLRRALSGAARERGRCRRT